MPDTYDICRASSSAPTDYVVARRYESMHLGGVLDTDQILERLKQKGIRNVDIARALDLPDSRVPEIRDKRRALKLDEGVKLIRAFGLEPDSGVEPLHPAIPRLIARHIARSLGLDTQASDPRMLELVADLQAFSRFVADPQVRASLDAAEAFFRAMDLRRAPGALEDQPQSDLQH